MGKYEEITALFALHEDQENAVSMKKYMKSQFDFYERLQREKRYIRTLSS